MRQPTRQEIARKNENLAQPATHHHAAMPKQAFPAEELVDLGRRPLRGFHAKCVKPTQPFEHPRLELSKTAAIFAWH
jgi:hypothetical protein